MKNKWLSSKMLVVYAAIILMVVWRTLVEIPNFTPILAVALFCGAYMGKKNLAFMLPLGALLVSDLIIGIHSTMLYVYLAFAAATGLGILISKKTTFLRVTGMALASAVVFFIITNLGVWLTGFVGYPMTLSGLLDSYVAAIPFFRTQLISTMAFSGVLFVVYYFINSYSKTLATS